MKTHRFAYPRMTDIICCFCVLVIFFSLCSAYLPYKEEKIYESVVRLHILANSDSEYDQNLKLAVRDAITQSAGAFLSGYETVEDTQADIEKIGAALSETANRVIAENGAPYSASFVWGRETYNTRQYDGISFPAGEYMSLRVVLGNGNGKNWWCVLFPPFCTSAATAKPSLIKAGIDSETQKTFTDSGKKKYVFKFKLLEWLFH